MIKKEILTEEKRQEIEKKVNNFINDLNHFEIEKTLDYKKVEKAINIINRHYNFDYVLVIKSRQEAADFQSTIEIWIEGLFKVEKHNNFNFAEVVINKKNKEGEL